MDLETFRDSLDQSAPPAGVGRALEALWRAAKGDWRGAHALAQAENDESGAWVHAYLHRVEGDAANAAYWYRRAGRSASSESLNEEWDEIASALLRRIGE